jgi:DNA-binding response OmpR family regulator
MDVMDITTLRWPAESDRRDALAADHVPRILVVEEGSSPPITLDCLEDWIRADAADDDVRARRAAVERRAAAHRACLPVIDEDGVLRFGDGWVSLPPVEGRLAAALVGAFGAVVSRSALTAAGWPTGASGRNALDVHILRLRRRLAGVGLVIRTVRSRGYLLEPAK